VGPTDIEDEYRGWMSARKNGIEKKNLNEQDKIFIVEGEYRGRREQIEHTKEHATLHASSGRRHGKRGQVGTR
jgi:hypothetical protein